MEDRRNVVQLTLCEGMTINPGSLAALRDPEPDVTPDCPVGEALEDLALCLSRLSAAYREDRLADLSRLSAEAGDIAARLGLDRLSRVARTVARLSGGTDCVALGANLARLIRLGDDALRVIWNHQDQIV